MTRFHVLFALMCLVWGLTWIAIKTGVGAVPPFFFAGLRLVTAGSLLLGFAWSRGSPPSLGGSPLRTFSSGVLVNTVTYGGLFWGLQYVPSGVSAVLNLSLVPVGLFAIGLVAREETFSPRKLSAIVFGVAGLGVLFAPKLTVEEGSLELSGMIAIVSGTLAYCFGSILSRPLLRRLDAVRLGGMQGVVGGLGLVGLALAFEPVNGGTLSALFAPPVLASFAFLVLGGSVTAFTVYLTLLRDWGPARAGLYAFVSPVIAVAVGVAFFAEPLGIYEIAGSTVMLGAAMLALRERASSAEVEDVSEKGTGFEPPERGLAVALDEGEKP